jgi:hypothetical protein
MSSIHLPALRQVENVIMERPLQAERADEKWQVQTFDPLGDGYWHLRYGHWFVFCAYELFLEPGFSF